MGSLDHWFQKERRRQERVVVLEDALLSGGFVSYAWYRLRYFAGRTLFATLLHAIEFLFLFQIFRHGFLLEALLVKTATVFANSWWWGGLETLREDVRGLQRDQKLRLAPRVISEWLGVSLACAAIVLLGGVTWIGLDALGSGSGFSLFHLYVLASCIRLALSLLVRTYHSGVYAMRRVYRPFLTLVCVDMSGFAGTLLLWPLWGEWSFPTVTILTSLVAAAITFHFVRQVYFVLGLLPLRPVLSVSRLRVMFDRRFFLAGSSYALMKMDALLVFALACQWYGNQSRSDTVIVFYLISPLVRASQEWAQLFYFDFKRLELDLFTNFRCRFDRLVADLSWTLGCICWLVACVYVTLFTERNPGYLCASLGAFFLIRSRFAFFQVHAFAARRYVPLFISGVLLFAGALLAGVVRMDGRDEQMLLLALVLVGATAYLDRSRAGVLGSLPGRDLRSAPEWLSRVASLDARVRIRSLRFSRDVKESAVERFARQLSRRIRGTGEAAIMENRVMVWYELVDGRSALPEEWLLRAGAGMIDALESTPYEDSGRCALRIAAEKRQLGRRLRPEPRDLPPSETVRERFLELFPDGIACEPGGTPPEELLRMTSAERHEVMYSAVQYSKSPFSPHRSRNFDVTTLCESGTIRWVFAVRKSADARERARWRSFIDGVNLGCGLGATSPV